MVLYWLCDMFCSSSLEYRDRHRLYYWIYCIYIGGSVAELPDSAAADAGVDEDEEQFVEERLLEAIENQLAAQQPPAVQAVLNKLTLVGHTREEIVQMMAQVLAWQISEMLEADHAFDMEAYERALRTLPQLPDAS